MNNVLTTQTNDKKVTATLLIAEGMVLLEHNVQEFKFLLSKSRFIEPDDVFTAIGVDNNTVYIGVVRQDTCHILLLKYTARYIMEDSIIVISEENKTIKNITCYANSILFISCNDDRVHSFVKDSNGLILKDTMIPLNDDIYDYGSLVLVNQDGSKIAVVGMYNPEDDECINITLYTEDDVKTLYTGISYDRLGLQGTFINDIITINDSFIFTTYNNDLKVGSFNEPIPELPIIIPEEKIDESNVKKHISKSSIIVPEEKIDTKQLPDIKEDKAVDKSNMIVRHHLVIQQLLNKISLGIQDNTIDSFSIKTLEMTEERVRITGLELKLRG